MKNILYITSLFFLISFQSFSQTITPTGSLNVPRWFHETQLLYNGKVLVFGGDDCRTIAGETIHASAQLYDITTGVWTNTGSMNVPRTRFASVVLPNGNVMAIGGAQSAAVEPKTATCEIYNVQTGTWSFASSMHSSCMQNNAILLKNGKVLVGSGLGLENFELYDPSTNTWTITSSPSIATGYGSNLVLLADGKVLSTYEQDAEIYDPATETWTLLSSKLIGVRDFHSAVLLNNGNVLITGGSNPDDQITAELFNVATQTFTAVPPMTQSRATSKAVLMDNGKVLTYGIGDFFSASNTKVIEVYDPVTNTWSSNVYNWIGTQAYSIVKLGNGKFLVSGGGFAFDIASTVCAIIDQNLPNCSTTPSLNMSASGQATCYGKGSSIILSTSETGVSYSVQLGSSTITKVSGTGNSITIPVAAENIQAGNNIFTVYAQKTNCPSLLISDTARVNGSITVTAPVITYLGTSICAGDSMKLSAPTGYASYTWSNKSTSEFIYAKAAGIYSVGVTTAAGCKSMPSNPVTISINPLVVPTIAITASQNPIIAGNVVTFTAATSNAGSAPAYQWKVNNIAVGNNSNTFSSAALNDGDLVSCTLTSNALCAKPASVVSNEIIITVKPFINYPKVLSTLPGLNALNVSESAQITVTFSKTMSDATAADSIFAVYGSYSGKIKGVYSKNGSTIIFTSNQYYFPGEKISILIDSAARDLTGTTMQDGYVSEFTVTAAAATANFTSGTDIQIYRPTKVISADLNNDGLLDIIGLPASGGIDARFNQGDGIFSSATNIDAISNYIYSINATDLNNDGFIDLCASYMYDKIISIYTNNKNGGFIKQNVTIPVSGENISTGDFNGDGKIDIVLQNYYTSGLRGIAILWNKNNNNFGLSSTILNITCNSYKTGDFDNDGDLDILACNGPLTLLKNNGKGTFTNVNIPILQKMYQTPEIVALGDFDKNGYLDPILKYNTTFGIIKNMGNSNFASFDSIGNSAPAAVHHNPAADFDGDGNLDLAFTNFSIGNIDTLDIWRNNGDGTFVLHSRKTLTDVYQIISLTSGDFDTDGDIDIATANLESYSISILLNNGTKPSIANLAFTENNLCASSNINVIGNSSGTFGSDNLFKLQLSDKNGSFSTPIDLGLPQKKLSNLILAQLPASLETGTNYRMRIVSTNPYIEGKDNGYNITIKTGCFTLTAISPGNHNQHINSTENIKATFSNNVSTTSPNLSIYGSVSGSYSANKGSFTKNDNTITFSPSVDFFAGEKIYVTADTSIKSSNGDKLTQPYLSTFTAKALTAPALFTHFENITPVLDKSIIAVGDLDNDHDIDMILTDVITDSLSFYLNTGDGTYIFSHSIYISNEGLAELGDFDRDGDLDLTIIDASNYIQIFQNDGHANFVKKQTLITSSSMIKNCDINADGYLDIVSLYGGFDRFNIFLNDGEGNLNFQKSHQILDLAWSFLVEDMDNDGDFDIIYGTNNHLMILYNYNNANSFLKTFISPGNWEVGNALCDINSDGFIDIIGTTSMLFNDANHTFSTSKTMDWDFQAYVIGVADFNGDAKSDLLVSDGLSSRIFANTGTSDFVERTKLLNTYNVFPGDVDNDGDIDIIGFDNMNRKIGSLINELSLKTVVVSEKTFCSISKIEVSFQNRGIPQGTTLSAQLSDATGNFNTFQVIGLGKTSPIICNVPSTVPMGNGYRIRIVCDSLNLISADNGINLSITTGCPVVQSVSPAINANNVEPNATILATFTTDLLASSINTNAIRIYGDKSGFKSMQQGLSLSSPSTIQYQTSTPFAAGEKVSVSLTHEIKNTNGVPLIAPYVYEFNIKPAPSSGNFILTENTYTNKSPGRSNIFKSGDFNSDGKIDLLITDLTTKIISILLNGQTNAIQFTPPVFYINDISILDIDIDGDLDLLITDTYNPIPLHTYKNDGQGNFTLTTKSNPGTSRMWQGDFNGDGNVDIITSILNNLSVNINNGQGVFTENYVIKTVDMNIYPSPKNLFVNLIVPVDLDSDGDIDLLGTANTSNSLYFIVTFLNDGQGKFTLQDNKINIANAVNNSILDVADFNNDGKMDIIFQTDYSTKSINIGMNTNGTYVISPITLNDYYNSIKIIDIDGDSDMDLITSGSSSRSVNTYKNNGTGSFTLFQTIPFDVYVLDIEAIDIDTDGDLDFALTTNTDLLILLNAEPSITTQPLVSSSICGGEAFTVAFTKTGTTQGITFKAELSDATGSFANNTTVIGTGASSPLSVTIPTSIAAGNAYRIRVVSNDLSIIGTNNGSDLNLIQGCLFIADVTPNANSNNISSVNSVQANFTTDLSPTSINAQSYQIYGNQSGFSSNKGTISLSTPSSISFHSNRNFFPNERVSVSLTTQIKSADNINLSSPFVYEFNVKPIASSGKFFFKSSNYNTNVYYNLGYSNVRLSRSGDFDNDGDLDIAMIQGGSGQLSIYVNSAKKLKSQTDLLCTGDPRRLEVIDIDADGYLDLMTVNAYSISIFRNNGDGSFMSQTTFTLSDMPAGLAVADFNGDGNMDFTTCAFPTGISVNTNAGNATFNEQVVTLTETDDVIDVASIDIDADGDMDIIAYSSDPNNLYAFENNGHGVFSYKNKICTLGNGVGMQIADLNNDNKMDFITPKGITGGFTIGFNTGNSFTLKQINVPYYHIYFDLADVDGDGDTDLMYSSLNSSEGITIMKNDGAGNFSLSETLVANTAILLFAANDIDNDGDLDIVCGNEDNTGLLTLYNGAAPIEDPISTGVKNTSLNNLRIYPNPTQDYINIDSPAIVEQITLYNVLGNEVLRSEQTNKINISELSPGMYNIKVVTDKGTAIQKICIE